MCIAYSNIAFVEDVPHYHSYYHISANIVCRFMGIE